MITGGCGDIGTATTRKLAGLGAKIVIVDLWSLEDGKDHARESGAADYLRVDQGNSSEIHEAVAAVSRTFGTLDTVIGNAAHLSIGRLLERTALDWEESLRVNVTGCAMLAQAAVTQMLKQPPDASGVRGRILFTSSWVGTSPYPGSIDYCASKAALDHLTRLVAQEYADQGIRVNAVAPGILDGGASRRAVERKPELKRMMLASIPVNKLGTSEQVADAFAFLCSPESNYITGHILFVDGGCSLTKRD